MSLEFAESQCSFLFLLFCGKGRVNKWNKSYVYQTHCRCFKREFTEAVAIRMWEACWSNYLTDYFHLFLCLAIIAVYADDVVAQDLRTDEMLLHFSSLGKRFFGMRTEFETLKSVTQHFIWALFIKKINE